MVRASHISNATRDRLEVATMALARADERVGRRAGDVQFLLLRGEGSWSTWIDGTWLPPREVAIAEAFGQGTEGALSSLAVSRATEYAVTALADPSRAITAHDIVTVHDQAEPDQAGLRNAPSWLVATGASHQDDATAPPPPETVPALVDEVAGYMSGTEGNPLLRAGIAYAQLDSVHPFPSGNGRTSRALLHALLFRTGALRWTQVPISTAFSRPMQDYYAGMASFRRGPAGLDQWLTSFCAATELAAEQVVNLADAVDMLNRGTHQRLVAYRAAQRRSPVMPRAGSVLLEVLQGLSAEPVMTIDRVHQKYGVSKAAAQRALVEMEDAGVLTRVKKPGERLTCWVADDYLLLVTLRGVFQ